jgi:carbamate kinase
LDVLVAMTQGQVGYLLQTAMTAVDPRVPVVAVLTRVRVAADDPAFENPTKPIGPFLTEAEARRESAERGWRVGPDAGRGWREIVPSPCPVEIVELEQLRALIGSGSMVSAGGGGGVPVVAAGGRLDGVEAVIDKDRCSAELALAVEADALVLLTAVPRVSIDFGTRWERQVDRMTAGEAARLLASGEFPPGSMGPKIESARRFVEGSGRAAVITSADCLREAVRGDDGTWIVADQSAPAAAA